MNAYDYGSIKILQFSHDITNEELEETGELLAQWKTDGRNYAIISHMSKGARTITDIPTIKRALSVIKNTGLNIYGIETNQTTDYLAKIIGELLGLKVKQFPDYTTMLEQIKKDYPEAETSIEKSDLKKQLASFA